MLMPGTPPTHERFDFLRSIARMSHDDTVAHRERWPDLDWVWDELDELRAERDNAVEQERDEALDERDTALPTHERFDFLRSIARMSHDDTVAHRERWPDLDWVWDELDELRAERDNAVAPEDLADVEQERDEALDERDTALDERDKLADANFTARAMLGDVSDDDDLLAVIRAACDALAV